MKSKHLVALAALFLFAAVARADDVQGPVADTSLIGKLHAPGESISYNFFVESFEINGLRLCDASRAEVRSQVAP